MAVRAALWLAGCVALSLSAFPAAWARLGGLLSPLELIRQHDIAQWAALGLCLLCLGLKRRDIGAEMRRRQSAWCMALGAALLATSLTAPLPENFLVFRMFLSFLGTFAILFGRAAAIPALLAGIYGFVLAFPLLIETFAQRPYALGVLAPAVHILSALGYPVAHQGQIAYFLGPGEEPMSVAVTAGCAGPISMGLFLGLFALMMLDIRLPAKKAAGMLLFGAAGTWLQNVLRIAIVIAAGHYGGMNTLETVHNYSLYLLFPLWYAIFAYVYLRQAGVWQGTRDQRDATA